MEIHLYSPLKYKLICETPINVIGFEYAGNPSYIDLLDRKVLEDSDTYAGVGISRTDIFSLVSMSMKSMELMHGRKRSICKKS
jgi:5-methyltetrahydropteroyltriglutamate--homocysteine methyltransferase